MNVPDTLTRLGGGDEAPLELVPSARPAFQQMAAAMLFTACMAVVSMWFALYDAVDVPAVAATVISLFWGLGILVIDRTLMLLGMGSGRAGSIVMALTRLLAAALIGVIVSTPLTLRIFASDIRFELGQAQLVQGDKNDDALTASPEKKRLDELQQSVTDWENVQAGTLPASFGVDDAAAVAKLRQQVVDLQAQEGTAQQAADQAAILYQCEMYGGGREQLDDPSKCAVKPGPNGNTELYHRQAVAAAETLATIQGKVASVRRAIDAAQRAEQGSAAAKLKELQANAPTELDKLENQVEEAQLAYDSLSNRLDEENLGNDGLMSQLTALWNAGERQKGLMVAHLLLALLFVFVEFMPVLSKLLWQFGRVGRAYEEAAGSLDDDGVAQAQTIRAGAQIEAETKFDVALLAKDARLDEEREETEQRLELLRIRHESERRVERARVQALEAQQSEIDGEFRGRREAELRRRAEAAHHAWEGAQDPGTVRYGHFGRADRSTPRTRWAASLRRRG